VEELAGVVLAIFLRRRWIYSFTENPDINPDIFYVIPTFGAVWIVTRRNSTLRRNLRELSSQYSSWGDGYILSRRIPTLIPTFFT
jgi:hypothetical protein